MGIWWESWVKRLISYCQHNLTLNEKKQTREISSERRRQPLEIIPQPITRTLKSSISLSFEDPLHSLMHAFPISDRFFFLFFCLHMQFYCNFSNQKFLITHGLGNDWYGTWCFAYLNTMILTALLRWILLPFSSFPLTLKMNNFLPVINERVRRVLGGPNPLSTFFTSLWIAQKWFFFSLAAKLIHVPVGNNTEWLDMTLTSTFQTVYLTHASCKRVNKIWQEWLRVSRRVSYTSFLFCLLLVRQKEEVDLRLQEKSWGERQVMCAENVIKNYHFGKSGG